MSRVAGRVFAMFGTRKVAAEQLAFPLSRQSKTDRTTDNRADLYALGNALRVGYRTKAVRGQRFLRAHWRHCTADPDIAATLDPEVPVTLSAIIMGLFEEILRLRPADALQLGDAKRDSMLHGATVVDPRR